MFIRAASLGAFALWLTSATLADCADSWPALPDRSGAVQIPAQEWPLRPGPREVRVGIWYPNDTLASMVIAAPINNRGIRQNFIARVLRLLNLQRDKRDDKAFQDSG